jgi:GT2 family glycosyltransferase
MSELKRKTIYSYTPKLSIIIITYNSEQVIEKCIESIYNSEKRENLFEIVLIDNNSSDNTVKIIEKFRKSNLKVFYNNKNLGFAKACNQGIRISKEDIILLLNPDTIIQDQAITKSLNFLCSQKSVGIVGCRINYPNGKMQYSCRKFPTLSGLFSMAFGLDIFFPKNKFLGQFKLTNFAYNTIKEVDVVSGAFFLIKGEVINDIGLLDENYFMYTEEMDFCFRAKRSDWKICFFSEAEIEHQEGHAAYSEKIDHIMFLQQHKSRRLFLKKHYPKWKTPIFWLIGTCETGVRYFFWTFVCVVKNNPSLKQKRNRYKNVFLWYLLSYNK